MLGLHRITSNQARAIVLASHTGIANAAGGSAGASVTTTISSFVDQYGVGESPANYAVQVTPSQACAVLTGKTTNGFSVTLTPLAPGGANATLAAGSFDVVIVG